MKDRLFSTHIQYKSGKPNGLPLFFLPNDWLGLFLPHRIAGKAAAELLEDFAIDLGEHDGGVYLTVAQLGQLLQCTAALLVVLREHAESYQYFVGMQAGVLAAEIFRLGLLNGDYHALGDELGLVVDTCEVFGGVQQQGSGTA